MSKLSVMETARDLCATLKDHFSATEIPGCAKLSCESCRERYEALHQAISTEEGGGWVSVEERLPERDERCLVGDEGDVFTADYEQPWCRNYPLGRWLLDDYDSDRDFPPTRTVEPQHLWRSCPTPPPKKEGALQTPVESDEVLE